MDAHKNEWISTVERVGQTWTGPMADTMAAERAAENEKEEGASISSNDKERYGRLREGRRKARVLSVSTSNSGENAQLPTPTGSTYSPSPSLNPVSPHQSEISVSTALSAVSETVESAHSNGVDHNGSAHKRAPSEPNSSPITKTSTHWRTHSSSGAVTKDKGERQDYFGKSTNSSGRGGKPGRRRGIITSAARGGFKKRGLGSECEPSGSQGTSEYSKRGRGSTRGGHSFVSGTSGSAQARKAASRQSVD